jgi:N-acetyl-anhydromuramyl-L-alanine amidase AmpD
MRFTFSLILLLGVGTVFAQDFVPPGRNKIAWHQSPNYTPGRSMAVDTVVLHHTASDNLAGTVKWFEMRESRVSAHFTVGKDGSIIQHLSTYDTAWHAGRSLDFFGRTSVNRFSVGIEIVNIGDGVDPYPVEQTLAVEHLISVMIRRFPIKQITSHEHIAVPPGRKPDPKGYPWPTLERFGLPMYFGRQDG